MLAHLPADMCQHFVPVAQFHSEHGIRKWFHHSAFDLDGPILFGHILRFSDRHTSYRYCLAGSNSPASSRGSHVTHPRPQQAWVKGGWRHVHCTEPRPGSLIRHSGGEIGQCHAAHPQFGSAAVIGGEHPGPVSQDGHGVLPMRGE